MGGFPGFPEATFEFLSGITMHNEKAWFDANRPLYEAGYVAPARAFVAALGPRLRGISPAVQFDPRINRDIRFSKDKRPYKTHLDLMFWHGEKRGWDSPGFWFRITTDEIWLGCGLYGMHDDVLESFRQSLIHPRSAKALLAAVAAVEGAGAYEIGEANRKLMPRGYDATGPAAKFLLNESLTALIRLPAPAARAATFLDDCLGHYRAMWPISEWLLKEVTGG